MNLPQSSHEFGYSQKSIPSHEFHVLITSLSLYDARIHTSIKAYKRSPSLKVSPVNTHYDCVTKTRHLPNQTPKFNSTLHPALYTLTTAMQISLEQLLIPAPADVFIKDI